MASSLNIGHSNLPSEIKPVLSNRKTHPAFGPGDSSVVIKTFYFDGWRN
jgi:hypothetical protein